MNDLDLILSSPNRNGHLIVKVRLVDEIIEDCIKIRPPNWNILDEGGVGFEYFDQILASGSVVNEKLLTEYFYKSGIDTSKLQIIYAESGSGYQFDNFVRFGSADELVLNFYYKVQVLENYDSKINELTNSSSSIYNISAINELKRLKTQKHELIGGFTGFEEFLYTDVTTGYGYPGAGSILSGSNTDIVKQWFDTALDAAETFDKINVHRLISNIPEYIIRDQENIDFITFLNMVGHHFDIVWTHINALKDAKFIENKKYNGIIDELVYPYLKSLGWNPNIGASSQLLWLYAFGVDEQGNQITEFSEKEYRTQIWRRILNNLPYILKNKGTKRSINAILAAYGIPEYILNVVEYGGPQDDGSDGIRKTYTYQDRSSAINFVSGSYTGSYISVDWKPYLSGSLIYPQSVELRLNTNAIEDQNIIKNNNAWSIDFVRTPQNTGYVEFTISGSSTLYSASTSEINLYNDTYTQILLNRVTGSTSDTYTIYAYEAARDRVRSKVSGSVTIPTGSSNWSGSNQLIVGQGFKGTIDEFRLWTEPLNTSSLEIHTLLPEAINGNDISSSTADLLFRLDFEYPKDRTLDPYIKNVAYNQSYATFATASNFYSASLYPYQYLPYERTVTGIVPKGSYIYTDKIRFESSSVSDNRLSPIEYTAKGIYDRSTIDSNKLGVFLSPTREVNLDIIKSFGDLYLDDFIGNPVDQYKSTYKELNDLRKYYFERTDLNPYEFVRLVKYIDKSIFEVLKTLVPARSRFSTGLLYEPHLLERSKYEWNSVKTEYNNLNADYSIIVSESGEYSTINEDLPIRITPNALYKIYDGNIDYYKDGVVSSSIYNLDSFNINYTSSVGYDFKNIFTSISNNTNSFDGKVDDLNSIIDIQDDTNLLINYEDNSGNITNYTSSLKLVKTDYESDINLVDNTNLNINFDNLSSTINYEDFNIIDFAYHNYNSNVDVKDDVNVVFNIDDFNIQLPRIKTETKKTYIIKDEYENIGVDEELPSVGGRNIFAQNGVAIITTRDRRGGYIKERKKVFVIKERYFELVNEIISGSLVSVSGYDEYANVKIERFRYRLTFLNPDESDPIVGGNIVEVKPLNGYLPSHYKFTNDLTAGLMNSIYKGVKLTSANTYDGKPVVEVFLTDPNTLKVNETGRGSGEPILFVE
jgi:hypothetical protein